MNFERRGKELTVDATAVSLHLVLKVQTHPSHLPGLSAKIWLIVLNVEHLVHWK